MNLDARDIEKVDKTIHLSNTNSSERMQKGTEPIKVDLEIDDDIMNMFK